ncbi:MAG: nucleoside diphosphate sugar epimerase family protein [Frankiales bacterium]|nr:nucleoside diphosphate sugar epimerase family protein [Frankiales bacterium]
MSDTERVLVTGATGHLGANMVRDRIAAGYEVRAMVRTDHSAEALAGLAIEQVRGDLRDLASVRAAVKGCRWVYHCGGKVSTIAGNQQELFETNVLGTRNLLDAAAAENVERVVVTSSLSVVGDIEGEVADERTPFNPFLPHTPYTYTKVLVELEAMRSAAAGEVQVVIAVPSLIMGPNDFMPSRIGKTLIDFAHNNLRAFIPGDHLVCTTKDIAAGHALAMHKGRSGNRYIFTSGRLSMDDMMAMYERVTGRLRPRLRINPAAMMGIVRVSSPVLAKLRPQRQQLITPAAVRYLTSHREIDTRRASAELGFESSSVEDAVTLAYQHFVERGVIRT